MSHPARIVELLKDLAQTANVAKGTHPDARHDLDAVIHFSRVLVPQMEMYVADGEESDAQSVLAAIVS